MRLLFLCVNHNTHQNFDRYFSSILAADNDGQVTVVLLDNSEFVSAELTKFYENKMKCCETFIYIRVPNHGYLGTVQNFLQNDNQVNIGAFDFICVSNVDLEISANFLEVLQTQASSLPIAVGMIAPSIITRAQIDKNPKIYNRPTSGALKIRRFLFSNVFTHFALNLIHQFKKRVQKYNSISQNTGSAAAPEKIIYAAHGSFLMFTKQSFDILTNETYPVFLFGEEIYLAERLQQMKLDTQYIPSLVISDTEHASTGLLKKSRYRQYNRDALTFLINEYFAPDK